MGTPLQGFARTLWPSEAPVDEGRVRDFTVLTVAPEHLDHVEARIAHPLAKIAGELHEIREALAPSSGRPLSLPNGGVCSAAGDGFVLYDGPRPGNIWRVELVVVSVTGASGGASVEIYNDGPTPDETNIAGFLSGLNGANPSRGFLAPAAPAVVFGGNPFLVRVLGAAANAQITCRIQGTNETIGD